MRRCVARSASFGRPAPAAKSPGSAASPTASGRSAQHRGLRAGGPSEPAPRPRRRPHHLGGAPWACPRGRPRPRRRCRGGRRGRPRRRRPCAGRCASFSWPANARRAPSSAHGPTASATLGRPSGQACRRRGPCRRAGSTPREAATKAATAPSHTPTTTSCRAPSGFVPAEVGVVVSLSGGRFGDDNGCMSCACGEEHSSGIQSVTSHQSGNRIGYLSCLVSQASVTL
mmetsp:Transcript_105686/g.340696  ORF Transcript_105686/g.340696 Transcript_105686/m.340696 type:complete len:228 (-) Transcript_105686:14-697(-)